MAEQIGRYQIIRLLGEGGMAKVYLAHDPEFRRDVAIKVLPAQLAADQQFLERFRREARTIAKLEHPAIVPVYDFGQHEGQPFLVMRYMPGGSLEDRLAGSRKLSLNQTAALFDRLAPALDEVHRQGIVHRDLKPGNILFDSNNQPYLSDFGIVKLGEGAGATLTATGGTVGTPAYMSPEQARGEGDLDSRSDIYSLGVILFQVLSGELPFKASTPVGLAVAHINEPVPDITTTAPDLPGGCQALIARAMAKDPAQRPPTATSLAADIDMLAAGLPLPYAAADDLTVIEDGFAAPTEAAVIAAAGSGTAPPPTAKRRWPLVAGGFGCLGFVVLIAIIALYAFSLSGTGLNSLGAVTAVPTTPPADTAVPVVEDLQPSPSATPEAASATPLPTPVPPIGSSNTFVEYIIDASGSMLEMLDGKTKLAVALDVLSARVRALPPDINVGLRVYGHRLPWENNEEASCDDIELVVPIVPEGGRPIVDFLPGMQAKGMTPMTASIRQAAEDFTYTPERNNLIILLSDGIETCDEEPAEAVKFLQELGIDFTIHVIGLAVDDAARAQLQALAAAGGGIYHDADSEESLDAALGDINDAVLATALAAQEVTETPTPAEESSPTATSTAEPPTATSLPSVTAVPPTVTPPPPTFTLEPPTWTPAPPTSTPEPPTATLAPPTEPPTEPPPSPTATAVAEKKTANITFEGKVSASSTYRGYPASLAVDGDRSTSWFSAGTAVDPNVSTFQWAIGQDELISSVTIISNANNAEPSFRTGFGFEVVGIQVLDAAGNVVFESRASLGGTPDPNVSFEPKVKGSTIVLNFSGHESPDCGGFGELVVMAVR